MERNAGSLAGRLGLGRPEDRDDAFSWRCVVIVLALFTVGFILFYPNAATNDDEAQYLRQAALILEGKSTVAQIDPLTGEEEEFHPSTYVPGLAAMMAPFVYAFGWRGAYMVPLLGLIGAVVFTGLALRNEGRSPIFALMVLGFAPALVMSRVAMSDVPSAAVVALALWCFLRGLDASVMWWMASGFLAGASITLRLSNPMVLAPLFAGTVIRREYRCWALVVGGLAGLAVRVVAMNWYFEDPFFERAWYPFAPQTITERLPFYLFGLLVLLPGGLVLALSYRGRRRPEIIFSILFFIAFYLCQRFSTENTGVAKRIVLVLRYLIPLLPVIAIACAESLPRLWRSWVESRDARARAILERRASRALATVIAAIAAAGTLVHPAFAWWGSTQADIRDAIHRHVPLDAVLVTNWPATRKFVRQLDRKFLMVSVKEDGNPIAPDRIRNIAERHPEVYLVLLDKSDSDYWREDAATNAQLLESLHQEGIPLELLFDEQASPTDRLRIWRIVADSRRTASAGGADPIRLDAPQ